MSFLRRNVISMAQLQTSVFDCLYRYGNLLVQFDFYTLAPINQLLSCRSKYGFTLSQKFISRIPADESSRKWIIHTLQICFFSTCISHDECLFFIVFANINGCFSLYVEKVKFIVIRQASLLIGIQDLRIYKTSP